MDIPDTMYRRIKTRTAQEGCTVRSITLVLYAQWLGDDKKDELPVGTGKLKRKRPSWFGSVKVDADKPHDMASVRRSIAKHLGE